MTDKDAIRIDKWLWHARFCRSRTLAQQKAENGLVRVNGARVQKPSATVRPGDVITLVRGHQVVALKVIALGSRRGPPSEAQKLYEILQ